MMDREKYAADRAEAERTITGNKISAYKMLRYLITQPEEQLKFAGYKSLGDACRKIILKTASVNEKIIQKFEKEHQL